MKSFMDKLHNIINNEKYINEYKENFYISSEKCQTCKDYNRCRIIYFYNKTIESLNNYNE